MNLNTEASMGPTAPELDIRTLIQRFRMNLQFRPILKVTSRIKQRPLTSLLTFLKTNWPHSGTTQKRHSWDKCCVTLNVWQNSIKMIWSECCKLRAACHTFLNYWHGSRFISAWYAWWTQQSTTTLYPLHKRKDSHSRELARQYYGPQKVKESAS